MQRKSITETFRRALERLREDVRAQQSASGRDPSSLTQLRGGLRYMISMDFVTLLEHRLVGAIARAVSVRLALLLHDIFRVGLCSDISPLAEIGGGARVVHSIGVVIGPGVYIGERCRIYSGVVLGKAHGANIDANGMPSVGNDCILGTGSKILGHVILGDSVVVGANAVVTKSVPPRATVVGVPARQIG